MPQRVTPFSIMTLTIAILQPYAECCAFFIVTLNVIMLNVMMPNAERPTLVLV